MSGKKLYPKMIYKTRDDYKIVNSLEEQIAALEDGYGEHDIMVLGIKPEVPKKKATFTKSINVKAKKGK